MNFEMKRMEQSLILRKFASLLALVMMIQLLPLTQISFAAAPKKGTLCKKLGQSAGNGSKRVTCTPVTSLRWVANPVKPVVGSIFAPAQMGKFVKLGTTSFRIKDIDFGIGSQICAVNAFNDGCSLGPKLEGLVDVNSEIRWIGLEIEIENVSNKAFLPSTADFVFYLVQSNNELIENNISGIVPNNLFDLTIESETKASGIIVFAVPKSVDTLNPLFLMRDQSKALVKDYYFLLDW
jgi:hypothetical protein